MHFFTSPKAYILQAVEQLSPGLLREVAEFISFKLWQQEPASSRTQVADQASEPEAVFAALTQNINPSLDIQKLAASQGYQPTSVHDWEGLAAPLEMDASFEELHAQLRA